MNGMLEHQELYREQIERHQAEARRWAHVGRLGRLSHGIRGQMQDHPRRSRFFAIASPMAVVLGLLAVLL